MKVGQFNTPAVHSCLMSDIPGVLYKFSGVYAKWCIQFSVPLLLGGYQIPGIFCVNWFQQGIYRWAKYSLVFRQAWYEGCKLIVTFLKPVTHG